MNEYADLLSITNLLYANIFKYTKIFWAMPKACYYTGSMLKSEYIRREMTHTSIGDEKQAGISGGSRFHI